MKKYIQIIFLLFSSSFCTTHYNGFCSVPIADLIGAPINLFFNIKNIKEAYKQIPYGDKRGHFGCPRIAQLLLHEPVIILEKKGEEIKIRAPFLQYPSKGKMHDTYWTLASNITSVNPTFKKMLPTYQKHKIITLKKPIYNAETQQTYYVGTQFVKTNKKKTSSKHSVYLYNANTQSMVFAHIPITSCLNKPLTKKNAKKMVIELCKEWANQKKGFIPYVFGGLSAGIPIKKETVKKLSVSFTKKPSLFYERFLKTFPRSGFDCARMFTRALQMSGAPFYAINTEGFKKSLHSLKKHEKIEEGDLILWKGHIAMISDIKKALLIEARSYDDGYGIVHEIPFSEQFKEIQTIEDLKEAYFSKKRITRLDKNGKKSQFIYDMQILKLSSAWNNKLNFYFS